MDIVKCTYYFLFYFSLLEMEIRDDSCNCCMEFKTVLPHLLLQIGVRTNANILPVKKKKKFKISFFRSRKYFELVQIKC